MRKFSLEVLKNCLEPGKDCTIQCKITCEGTADKPEPVEDEEEEEILKIEISLAELVNHLDIKRVKGSLEGSQCKIAQDGLVTFTFDLAYTTTFKEHIFTIEKLNVNSKFAQTASISFSLFSQFDKITDADYGVGVIVIQQDIPVINSFKLSPSIVQNLGNVAISLDCEKVSSLAITYGRNKAVNPADLPPINKSGGSFGSAKGAITKGLSFARNDTTSVYLKAKLGEAIAIKNSVRKITVLDSSAWIRTALIDQVVAVDADGNPDLDKDGNFTYWEERSTIVDLVLNEFDDKIWAFAKGNRPDDPVCLWFSEDGLEWSPYLASRKDNLGNVIRSKVIIPADLVHCPAVHFRGKLYFVCGSKADFYNRSNVLKELDFASDFYAPEMLWPEIKAPVEMAERSLHGCVVFPNGATESIWVIGGADKKGNGLNDVWMWDGIKWERGVAAPGFPARCQFSATVRTNREGRKESIWIAGGVDSYEGDKINDIWSLGQETRNQWVNIQYAIGSSLVYSDNEWIKASTLTFLPVNPAKQGDPVNIIAVDFYKNERGNDGMNYRQVSKDSKRNEVQLYKFDEIVRSDLPRWSDETGTSANYAISAIGFNGCIWIMAIVYKSKERMMMSDLYYSCPL